jgi:hypothetical protein
MQNSNAGDDVVCTSGSAGKDKAGPLTASLNFIGMPKASRIGMNTQILYIEKLHQESTV